MCFVIDWLHEILMHEHEPWVPWSNKLESSCYVSHGSSDDSVLNLICVWGQGECSMKLLASPGKPIKLFQKTHKMQRLQKDIN